MEKRINHGLWQNPVSESAPWQRPIIWFARLLYALLRDLLAGQINLRAMSLVYTALLSLVPLLALSFSVLKAFGVHNQLEPVLHNLLEPLGEKGLEITQQILEFVSNMKVAVLGAVGLGILVYTVLMLMHKIQRSLDFTWELQGVPGFGKRIADYLALLLIGPLVVFSVVSVVAGAMESSMMQSLLKYGFVAQTLSWLVASAPFVMLLAAMSFVYWFLPNTGVRWYAAICGGLVAAFLWKMIGWLFATFIASSGQYMAIYSAFATVLLFMIWLYLAWLILLLGSRIAFYIQHPQRMRPRRAMAEQGAQYMETSGLVLLQTIYTRFAEGKPPLTADALSRRTGIPALEVVQITSLFVEVGLLSRNTDNDPALLPSRPAEKIKLAEVFSILREGEQIVGNQAILKIISLTNKAIEQSLNDSTVADLLK